MKVIVDNRLRIVSPMSAELRAEIEEVATRANPKWLKLKRMGFAPWSQPKEFKLWKTEKTKHGEHLSVARGMTNNLRRIAAARGESIEWLDFRSEGEGSLSPPLVTNVEERSYQVRAVAELAAKQSSVLRADTGTGKTTMALMLAAKVGLPTLVIVWNQKLLEQWLERIEAEMGLSGDDVGIIQGSTKRIRCVTVAMQQTLNRAKPDWWANNAHRFGVVFLDEAQRCPAASFLDVIDRFPAKYRIGMSDDVKRKDGLHFLTSMVIGEHVVDVEREEGTEADAEVRMIPTSFKANWYRFSKKPDFNKLLEKMTADRERNELATWCASQVIDSGAPVILFSHRREHCASLGGSLSTAGYDGGLMIGGADSFDETSLRLASGQPCWGAATIQAAGTGIDMPALGFGVATTPVHTNKQQYRQIRGRLRKRPAVLYVLWDVHVFGRLPLVNMLRWNKVVRVWDESAKRFVDGREYQGRMVAEQVSANELG